MSRRSSRTLDTIQGGLQRISQHTIEADQPSHISSSPVTVSSPRRIRKSLSVPTPTPTLDPPVKIEFNKVYALPVGLGKDDEGSLWLCDFDRIMYVWTAGGWSVYDGGDKGGGGGAADGAVLYDKLQDLSDSEKSTARTNISAAFAGDITALQARLDALDDELHPWELRTFIGGGVYEKYSSPTATFTWSTGMRGQEATTLPDETFWNGTKIDNTPQSRQVSVTSGTGTYTYTLRVRRGSKDLSSSRSMQFVCRSYYGVVGAGVTSLTEPDMEALANNALRTGRGGTYAGVTLANQKVAWCYPAAFGPLTRILDGNNFDLTDSFTRSELKTDKGDWYYIYLLTKPVTNTGLKFIFS